VSTYDTVLGALIRWAGDAADLEDCRAAAEIVAEAVEQDDAPQSDYEDAALAHAAAWRVRAEKAEARAERLRAEIRELAEDFASNVDWSPGRSSYGDNGAWESAARELHALTAQTPAPSPDST